MRKNSKTNPALETEEAIEYERLHGADVNPFACLAICQILQRVIRKAGTRDIRDDDLWETIGFYITRSELQGIIDIIIPSKKQQKKYIEEHFNCFGLGGPSIANTLENLFAKLIFRKAIWKELAKIMEKRIGEYRQDIENTDNPPPPWTFKTRLDELKSLLGLNDREGDILTLLFLQQNDLMKLGDFAISNYQNSFNIKKISIALGISEQEIAECFSSQGILRKYNIIEDDAEINSSFMNFFTGINSEPLNKRFWTKFDGKPLPWEFHGAIAEQHGKVIMDMINGKTEDVGLSILLYGCAGSGKTSFAVSLAERMGKEAFFIAQSKNVESCTDYSPNFRYAALAAAQRQLDPQKSILIIDECDDMLESYETNGDGWGFFTMKKDGAEAKGQLNTVIDQNRHTLIWICNSQQNSISASSRRRFDYSVLFDELLPETRARIWENCLKQFGCENLLSQVFIKNISCQYKVNAGGIAVAVKNAKLVHNSHPEKNFSDCIIQFLMAHCNLLGIRRSHDERLEPAKDYTLDGLNIQAGLRLERIIEICRLFIEEQKKPNSANHDRPHMNLLLHGVPGSGKTEFVKYLAKQIGSKLNIKNASDLLSCYVGGTEHLLAEAFAEAEKNNEILFIDEGDSMLSSRASARQSWEVSQVNTLLTEMENFNGIFIVSTNLIQKLDAAAIRRFTFKIHFDYLDNSGKRKFYDTYFKHLRLPSMTDAEQKALLEIPRLTPSDFRNVRQQFFYLSTSSLTNSEIIEALRQEASSRDAQGSFKNLGEEKHGIGFGNH